MNPPRKPTIGTSGPPGHANLEEDQLERELDEALLETFPASDPIAITSEDERDEARRQGRRGAGGHLPRQRPARAGPAREKIGPQHPGGDAPSGGVMGAGLFFLENRT